MVTVHSVPGNLKCMKGLKDMTSFQEYEFYKQRELLQRAAQEREWQFRLRDYAINQVRKEQKKHGWSNLSAFLLGIIPVHEKKHRLHGRSRRYRTGDVPAGSGTL